MRPENFVVGLLHRVGHAIDQLAILGQLASPLACALIH
jgi:hypothetical protein